MENSARQLRGLPQYDEKERRKRQRERWAILGFSLLLIAFTFLELKITRLSTSLPFVNSLFFFGLININIILLTVVLWLIVRNIGKLFIERRRQVLGSRLKTKLVLAFLGFSITPTIVLFIISALYIHSSFDKWFSIKVQNTLQASLDITARYYEASQEKAAHFANHLSQNLNWNALATGKQNALVALEGQRRLLALDGVEFYSAPFEDRIAVIDPKSELSSLPRLSLEAMQRGLAGESFPLIHSLGEGDLIRSVAPIRANQGSSNSRVVGVVVVNAYIPVSLMNKVGEIASVHDDYRASNPLKYPIKSTYFIILIMITLVILFVAIWGGLHMAKEITVPLEGLVEGARAVGSGNLDVSIAGDGHDEISELVRSFNQMTTDLRENRRKLLVATDDVEGRRLQLETVLSKIGSGVVSLDGEGSVVISNSAFRQLLDLGSNDVIGKSYRSIFSVFGNTVVQLVEEVLSEKNASAISIEWGEGPTRKNFRISAQGLPKQRGAVVVVEDLTPLVKSQREMAWREVARRIAHEIKNPLTPIKLSAQRLQRRLSPTLTGKDQTLLNECADVIVRHCDELKEMVNEFSHFAQLPDIAPVLANLNDVIDEALELYRAAHPSIDFSFKWAKELPQFEFDRDQLKRCIINLLDNAIAAFKQNPVNQKPKIEIATHFHADLKIAAIVIADNGMGMGEEVLDRIFEPYFSTKKEGTGLGLAIVKKIINDHDGFIRVTSRVEKGSKFLIELPTRGYEASNVTTNQIEGTS